MSLLLDLVPGIRILIFKLPYMILFVFFAYVFPYAIVLMFLSIPWMQWALMTLLDPIYSVENLIYIGYAGDPSSAIRVTRRRRLDRKKQQSDRNVYQCFVFGPKEAGKSAILNSFIGRFLF